MFRNKIKNFFLLTLIATVIFVLTSKTILAQVEEPLYLISLDFQKSIQDFLKKVFPQKEDSYKAKYYELLQELAKLKLTLKNVKEIEGFSNGEKYLPNLEEVKVLKKDSFGYYYISNFYDISEGMVVLDENWLLVGRIIKVFKNYSLVESLEVPNLEFNVADVDGQLLGLAKTISNGFLEVNFVDPKIKVNLNSFVLTEKGYFPSGLVVGSVVKIYKSQFNQKIIVRISFNPEASKFLVIKK